MIVEALDVSISRVVLCGMRCYVPLAGFIMSYAHDDLSGQ